MSTRSRQPLHVILDWDGTLTEKDTLSLVAKVGYDKQKLDLEKGQSLDDASTGRFILPWSEYGRLYMLDYSAHKDEYRPKAEQRTTLEAERKWLKSLLTVEDASARRVQQSELFHGVGTSDIAAGAESAIRSGELKLRKGWESFLRQVVEDGSKVPQSKLRIPNMQRNKISILSVNWSETFIRKAIEATQPLSASEGAVGPQHGSGQLSVDDFRLTDFMQNKMEIYANEIQGCDREGGSSGALCGRSDIRTSRDKVDKFPERNRDNLDIGTHDPPSDKQTRLVYVGDSDTDMECLLAADVGICIRDEPLTSAQTALSSTLERLQVATEHVGQLGKEVQGFRIWWARDFEEIQSAMQDAGFLWKSQVESVYTLAEDE